jgi:competence transcription factor ComK
MTSATNLTIPTFNNTYLFPTLYAYALSNIWIIARPGDQTEIDGQLKFSYKVH